MSVPGRDALSLGSAAIRHIVLRLLWLSFFCLPPSSNANHKIAISSKVEWIRRQHSDWITDGGNKISESHLLYTWWAAPDTPRWIALWKNLLRWHSKGLGWRFYVWFVNCFLECDCPLEFTQAEFFLQAGVRCRGGSLTWSDPFFSLLARWSGCKGDFVMRGTGKGMMGLTWLMVLITWSGVIFNLQPWAWLPHCQSHQWPRADE